MFAGLAGIAGGLQSWAFITTGAARHLVVGIFAISVAVSVLVAVIRSLRRDPPQGWRL